MSTPKRLDVIGANPNLRLIAVPLPEAAAALGMHINTFRRHVQGDLKLILDAGDPLVRVRDLEEWAERHAEHPLGRAA